MKKILILNILLILFLILTVFIFLYERTSQYPVPSPDVLSDTVFPGNPNVQSTTSNAVVEIPPSSVNAWHMTPERIVDLEKRWTRYDRTSISTSTKHYSIGYADLFDGFTIFIFAEPAAQYRAEAAQELRDALGVNNDILCDLNVSVLRRTELTNYTDIQKIGLNFCPGSVSDTDLVEVPYNNY